MSWLQPRDLPDEGARFINGSGALRGEGVNARLDFSSLRAQRSNPSLLRKGRMDCFASLAMTAVLFEN
jgi:hypothetical protein